jgi:hypothetical protein
MTTDIGRIKFRFLGKDVTATLTEELLWEATDKQAEDILNTLFTGYTPADGEPGIRLLERAAASVKVKPEIFPFKSAPEGTVY